MASKVTHSVDGRNPAPVEVGSFSHYFRVLYIPGGAVQDVFDQQYHSHFPIFPFPEPLSQAAQKASQLLLKVHQKEHQSNDVPKNTYLACQNCRSTSTQVCWLVVSTHLKNIEKCSKKWESSPSRGENEKSLKQPPSLFLSL